MSQVDAQQVSLLQSVPLNELGARIRAARVAAGLTQTELGGPDATVSYVSRIESGNRRPDPRVLEAFASRLGVTVEELLTYARTPTSLETPVGEDGDAELGDFIEDRSMPDPSEVATHHALKEQVREVLQTLTERFPELAAELNCRPGNSRASRR